MPLQNIINILTAFDRYLTYMNDNGHDEVIKSITEEEFLSDKLLITLRGHMGETYDLRVYLSSNELHIENPIDNTSLFDILDYEIYELTSEKLNYIKFGK